MPAGSRWRGVRFDRVLEEGGVLDQDGLVQVVRGARGADEDGDVGVRAEFVHAAGGPTQIFKV